MTPVTFQLQPNSMPSLELEEESLPVTSYSCLWKPPRKRKQSNLPIAEAKFEKHVYGKAKKRFVKAVETFDPRPIEYRGTVKPELTSFTQEGSW